MTGERLQRMAKALDKLELTVSAEGAGQRADQWISVQTNLTRSAVQKLCSDGLVACGERAVPKNGRLREGEILRITVPEPVQMDAVPQNIPVEIVYEDEDLLVVNKPKGMVVHPAPGNCDGTLVNALLYHCKGRLSSINGVVRPGIVHRIDKDTSGLLIVAKNDASHAALAEQIKAHRFTRIYNAIVYGGLPKDEGTVEAPIGRNPNDRMKMCVTDRNSRHATTHYRVRERLGEFTNLELRLETGRTHQIRVHMAYIGHPVAGDPVYGPKKVITRLGGQCLHARTIGFIHPHTGDYMEFTSALPDYYESFLWTLRKKSLHVDKELEL